MAAIAVFGYGSLVDVASASATLGREVGEIRPATLAGWRRRFSQARDNATCEKTFARGGDGSIPEWILGLNLERSEDPGEAPNGGLLEVTEADLKRLDMREIRYDRLEVTAAVRCDPPLPRGTRVITYVSKPAHLAVEAPAGAVILRSYAEAVEAAFERFGAPQLERYRRTTPYPVELIDGVLVRDEIPEGNPREW